MSNSLTDSFISYVSGIRRYSPRTQIIYREALDRFFLWMDCDSESPEQAAGRGNIAELIKGQTIRAYEVHLLDDEKMGARTTNLHLSILSSFCKYLVKEGLLQTNPVRLVPKPKSGKRLPVFYREESMEEYFRQTEYYVSDEFLEVIRQTADKENYRKMLNRLIVSILYGTGIRRSELIGLTRGSVDTERSVLRVRGKGDKVREIPMTSSLLKEISLYLIAVSSLICFAPTLETPLLMTPDGGKLYPVFVDRTIKEELGDVAGITGRKSPHVLRHTIASELLDKGADLNSIKEFLGHSSLAATQVYTHSTIERLQKVYNNAHPRAKKGGNNGD